MCTIIILNHVTADLPLVIAANRDEIYARSATGPQVIQQRAGPTPQAIGGVDEALGGTWMGATEDGLFVGLTNQRTFQPPNRELRSRGQLVSQALRCGSVAAIHDFLETLEARQYNPFNLLYGDGRTLELARAGPEAALSIEPVPQGAHVLPNDRLDSDDFPKVQRAQTLLGDVDELGGLTWHELQQQLTLVLSDHERPPVDQIADPPAGSWLTKPLLAELQALCIHTEFYGTCSATIVGITPGRVDHYLFAAGSPCTEAFEDITSLLAE
ncbi:MAG: hypothetical protein DRI90_11120 [Deltaproteobacteria bacterium]|nr:MAG: hypothetical protein DRI90_11120 [Deltaproteobacteria bacterium]